MTDTIKIVTDISQMTDAGIVLLAARLAENELGLAHDLYPQLAARLDTIGRRISTMPEFK